VCLDIVKSGRGRFAVCLILVKSGRFAMCPEYSEEGAIVDERYSRGYKGLVRLRAVRYVDDCGGLDCSDTERTLCQIIIVARLRHEYADEDDANCDDEIEELGWDSN
jgi:hypothetical protein